MKMVVRFQFNQVRGGNNFYGFLPEDQTERGCPFGHPQCKNWKWNLFLLGYDFEGQGEIIVNHLVTNAGEETLGSVTDVKLCTVDGYHPGSS